MVQIEKRKDRIKHVEGDIRTVHRMAEETQRRIREDTGKQQSLELQNYNTKKSALEEEVAGLKKSLLEVTTSNRESEQKLRKVGYMYRCM